MATLTKTLLPISGYTNQYYTYQCVVTENSYSVTNNTSNVTVTLSIKGPWAPSFYQWTTNYGIMIDGVTKKSSSSSPYVSTSYIQLLSWTGDVSHDTDGSKKINIGVYLYHSGPSSYLPKQYTSSSPLSMGSVTLTTIPRASSISSLTSSVAVNGDNKVTVEIDRKSSSFTHSVRFYVNDEYTSETFKNVDTKKSFTIPKEWLSSMSSSTSHTAYCVVTTYKGENKAANKIGSSVSKTFKITVPSNVMPTLGTVSRDAIDITTVDGVSRNILVQKKNKVTISVSGATAGFGSSIKSYTFAILSGSTVITSKTTTTPSCTLGPFSQTGTLKCRVTVTDNRSRSVSNTGNELEINCNAYSEPSIKELTACRVSVKNDEYIENDNGKLLKCSYKLSYAPVDNTNGVTVQLYYKKNSEQNFKSITIFTNQKTTSGFYVIGLKSDEPSIDAGSTYTVYATITDNYNGNSPSGTITVFGSSRMINITPDGTGVAFGKMAESNNLLESKYKIKAPGFQSTRDGRAVTDLNIAPDSANLGTFETFIAKSDKATNIPSLGDGHIAHFHWDYDNGYDSQLYLKNATGAIMSRGCNGGTWGDWRTSLDSVNYTDYVSKKPTTLYSSSSGSTGTITLSQSAANFSYLEIFYTDNNSRQPNCAKINSPNGKYISLSCMEPSTVNSDVRLYLRTSAWTISGTSMTVGRTSYNGKNDGVFATIYSGGTVSVEHQQHIKIYKILGYK